MKLDNDCTKAELMERLRTSAQVMSDTVGYTEKLRARAEAAERERDEARDWVRRLTAEERTLTCVYCGHAYPPGTPAHGSEVLTAHIATCEKHPLRAIERDRDRARAREEVARLRIRVARYQVVVKR